MALINIFLISVILKLFVYLTRGYVNILTFLKIVANMDLKISFFSIFWVKMKIHDLQNVRWLRNQAMYWVVTFSKTVSDVASSSVKITTKYLYYTWFYEYSKSVIMFSILTQNNTAKYLHEQRTPRNHLSFVLAQTGNSTLWMYKISNQNILILTFFKFLRNWNYISIQCRIVTSGSTHFWHI